MLGFLKLWEGLEAVLYSFKAVCVRSYSQVFQGFTTQTRAPSGWSTISIGYRLIESYQLAGERLSINLLEIYLIERNAVEAGVGGHVFLKGRG